VERRQKLKALQEVAQGDANIRADLMSANSLAELFGNIDFKEFSFSQWKEERKKYLEEAVTTRTLFLFDEDLSRDGGGVEEGRELVRQVLASDARTAMVGLISHNILPEKEFEVSKEFTDAKYGFDPAERVVPIAKSSLGSNPLVFARTIKLTALGPNFHELKKLSLQVMKEAQTKAETELHAINLHTFAHIVFDASNHEGIWEPDTVFRLINLYQRKEARSLAAQNEGLRNLAEEIRLVSNIPTASGKDDRPDDAWKVQRLELYENREFLNSSLLPIELGDIFEKEGKDGGDPEQYVLLAQPCDLMVRPEEGKRKGNVSDVVLALVSNNPNGTDASEHFTLPHYIGNETDKKAYALFTRTIRVSLNILDLCAFNSDGSAKIRLDEECGHVIDAWRKHHDELVQFFGQLIEARERVLSLISAFNEGKPENETIPGNIIEHLTAESSRVLLFDQTINASNKTITFNCQRVSRLERNHAAAMWTKYCNFMARAAFDVDVGE
jgi:hypothetical protein